jgi:hypothetical protein
MDYSVKKTDGVSILSGASATEAERRVAFFSRFKDCPIPDNELLSNMGLFIKRHDLSRLLFMHELYKQIIDVHGIVCEFGVRWGQNMALFHSFRGMYEPFNYNRKIIGFDTFEGFPSVSEKDGDSPIAKEGAFSVTENYYDYLDSVLAYHESESPIGHIKKYELIKGDASKTFPAYLKQNPETIVAFAYFDFDIYQPTRDCLELLLPRLTKGSVIGFDELNFHPFPGETLAVMEVIGLSKYRIRRNPQNPNLSWIVIE